jgi:hypothetical protein
MEGWLLQVNEDAASQVPSGIIWNDAAATRRQFLRRRNEMQEK